MAKLVLAKIEKLSLVKPVDLEKLITEKLGIKAVVYKKDGFYYIHVQTIQAAYALMYELRFDYDYQMQSINRGKEFIIKIEL